MDPPLSQQNDRSSSNEVIAGYAFRFSGSGSSTIWKRAPQTSAVSWTVTLWAYQKNYCIHHTSDTFVRRSCSWDTCDENTLEKTVTAKNDNNKWVPLTDFTCKTSLPWENLIPIYDAERSANRGNYKSRERKPLINRRIEINSSSTTAATQ